MMNTNSGDSSATNQQLQKNQDEEVFNFPNEFYETQGELGSSYSVKYLGITNGKIGILSRRVPIPKITKEKPDRSAVFLSIPPPQPKPQILPPVSATSEKNEPVKAPTPPPPPPPPPKEKTPEPKKESPKVEKTEEVYQNKFSGNIPAYVPIGTTSLNDMFSRTNYLSHPAKQESGFSDETEKPSELIAKGSPNESKMVVEPIKKEEPPKEEVKKEAKKSKKKSEKVKSLPKKEHDKPFKKANDDEKLMIKTAQLPTKPKTTTTKPNNLPSLSQRMNEKAYHPLYVPPKPVVKEEKIIEEKSETKEESKTAYNFQYPPIPDELLPHPEKYNEHLVHTYSLPKALPVCRKQKVLSEAEKFDSDKYSKENILAAIYPKISGVTQTKRQGFKGCGLPVSELHKTKLLFQKSKSGVLAAAAAKMMKTEYPENRPENNFEINVYGTNNRATTKEKTPFILENEIIKEKTLIDENTEKLKLPEITGKDTVELLSKIKENKEDPETFVNENNRIINMLLSENNKESIQTSHNNDNIISERRSIEEEDRQNIINEIPGVNTVDRVADEETVKMANNEEKAKNAVDRKTEVF